MERRRPSKTAHLDNESGQAALEYVLLLFISVIIILSVIYQFNSAFRVFASNFFGEYIACLIETGDLPGVSQECQSKFMAFDLSKGKRAVSGFAGDNNSTSGSGSNGKTNGKGGKNGSGNGSNGSKGSSSAAGSGSGDGSSDSGSESGGETIAGSNGNVTRGGRGSGQGLLKSRQSKTAVGSVAGKGAGEEAKGKGDSLLGVSATSAVGNVGATGVQRVVPVTGSWWGEEDEKQREAERPAVASLGKSNTDNDTLKPKKAVEKTDRAPAKQKEIEDKEFSAGRLLRLLLIVAIIIIILVFFGGQAMQISKSWEK